MRGLGSRSAPHRARVPPDRPGPPQRGAAAGDPATVTGPLALRPLGSLRPLEELIELFIGAGFDPHGALHAARLFTGFLYGHVQHELQEQVHDPDETDDLLRLGLHRLPITQFPRLRSLATVLAAYDGAAELDEGLDIVLAGLRSQLLN